MHMGDIEVRDINSDAQGIISKLNNKFVVRKGTKLRRGKVTESLDISTKTEILRLAQRLTDANINNGVTIKDVSFNTLEEAVKAIFRDPDWEKYVVEEEQDILKGFRIPKVKANALIELLEKCKEVTENITEEDKEADLHIENEEPPKESEMTPVEMMAHALGKMLEPKPVDISEKSMQRIEEMHKPIEETPKEEIDNDFDWGEDESEITTEDLVGVDFSKIDEKLKSGRGAVILEGVPGTGKTKAMMAYLNSKAKAGAHIEKITFHQEYTYQEFIGGITCPDGEFKYIPGVFTKLCYEACKHPEREYYLGIDEFSRGNTEAILGEVMTAICTRGMVLTLSNGRKIKVPKNLYIIATMNVTDNSTKDIDIATFQRFNKFRLVPRWTDAYVEKVANGNTEVFVLLSDVAKRMDRLNSIILNDKALGKDRVIGVRDITLENPTAEGLAEVIDNDLIKTIERTVQMYYGQSKSEIDNIIREIKGICNEFKKEARAE